MTRTSYLIHLDGTANRCGGMRLRRGAGLARWWLASACLALVGCGETSAAFSSSFPDNRGSDVWTLVDRVQRASPSQVRPVAVGITSDASQLYAFDLAAGRILWRQAVDTSVAPLVAGDFVVTKGSSGVLVSNLVDGTRHAAIRAADMRLQGAAADGQLLAIALAKGADEYAESRIVAVRDGALIWDRRLEGVAGVPAVVGETVVVPWNHQNLSALDGDTGIEFARVRLLDAVIGHAFMDRGRLFAGSEQGILEVTASLSTGSKRGVPHFALPDAELPGRPSLLPEMYSGQPLPEPASARHHIQLTWLPAVKGQQQMGLEDNSLYLVFYRFVWALDPTSYAVRWVHTHGGSDIVGAQAQPGGVVFADETGHLAFLSARSGAKLWQAETGVASSVVSVRPGPTALAVDGGPALTPGDVREQLLTAARHPDARLVPARVFAVSALAQDPNPVVTGNLIELCDDRATTPPVRDVACDALAKREVGAEQVLAALGQHAAFLQGTKAPPVGALARAAVKLNEGRAVAPLVAHLQDPNTESRALPDLIQALAELNDRTAVEPLASFLRMYHADASDEHLVEALGRTADALVALGGASVEQVLSEVAEDDMGSPAVRERVRAALDELDRQKMAAELATEKAAADAAAAAEQASQAQEQGAQAEQAKPQKPEGPPERLDPSVVEKVLLPVRDQLRECLRSAKKQALSARVLMVVDQGQVGTMSVVPKHVQSCIEPLIRSQKFPRTLKGTRERVTHTIRDR